MAIITLTTDLGTRSPYAAVLKGVIHSMCKPDYVIDISHEVSRFDIMETAFLVKHAAFTFPTGSIHLVGVDPDANAAFPCVVMAWKGHFFVGPNNGVLSLIAQKAEVEVVEITHEGLIREDFPRAFRAARVLAPTAAFLASGGPLQEIGPATALHELRWGDPTYASNALRGTILHIDRFGNAITNIDKSHFLKIRDGRSFEIFLRNLHLRRIVTTYGDVGKSEALAIFGQHNLLEIALRESSAAQLLGLSVRDMVTIEFSAT